MNKVKTWFHNNRMVLTIAVIFAGVIKASMIFGEYTENKTEEWKNAACPSLFSIARSARDTLIVMKSHSECNKYVMENLK